MEDVPDQVAQGFVVIHGPCGGNGTRVKNAATFGTFPIDDFGNGLLVPCPRSMTLGIEIQDVPFAIAAGGRPATGGIRDPNI